MWNIRQVVQRMAAESRGCSWNTTEFDAGAANLVCAAGCPGAENLPIRAYVKQLDDIATLVSRGTAHLLPDFKANPAEYDHSEPQFCMSVMFTVLQRNLRISYNMDLVNRDDFFADPQNLFIHGILDDKKGTCTSLPPFFLAIGRRIGYPLRLVTTKQHHFIRWEGRDGVRFNIECTSKGVVSYPDDHYRSWPFPVSPGVERACHFLRSKSPRQEMAVYLTNRGHCFHDNGRFPEAADAYGCAAELDVENQLNREQHTAVLNEWRARLDRIWPAGFPTMNITFPPRQFRHVEKHIEYGMLHLKTMDDLFGDKELDAKWWAPLRQGRTPADVPGHIKVTYETPTRRKIEFVPKRRGA